MMLSTEMLMKEVINVVLEKSVFNHSAKSKLEIINILEHFVQKTFHFLTEKLLEYQQNIFGRAFKSAFHVSRET